MEQARIRDKFGKYMETLRKRKKLSQAHVGSEIGTTRQYVDAIEKNKQGTSPPNFQKLERIANVILNK